MFSSDNVPFLTVQRPAPINSGARKPNPGTRRAPPLRNANNRRQDDGRLAAALNNAGAAQTTVRNNNNTNNPGIAIKGTSSGPFTVVGSNFAPGTTAADIQSAVEPIAGQTLSCFVTSERHTVTAEITFDERWSAENAIANFHNQKVFPNPIRLFRCHS